MGTKELKCHIFWVLLRSSVRSVPFSNLQCAVLVCNHCKIIWRIGLGMPTSIWRSGNCLTTPVVLQCSAPSRFPVRLKVSRTQFSLGSPKTLVIGCANICTRKCSLWFWYSTLDFKANLFLPPQTFVVSGLFPLHWLPTPPLIRIVEGWKLFYFIN